MIIMYIDSEDILNKEYRNILSRRQQKYIERKKQHVDYI